MENIHIYFMPGMAANAKIFEKLTFPAHYQLNYLEWIDPLKNETISAYSSRMCTYIQHENPVLIGVSFGGIIVQEIKKQLKTRKTIIVSSIKSTQEFSILFRISKTTRLYKLLPFFINHILKVFFKVIYGKKSAKHINLYKYYLTKRDSNYLHWALYHVLNWKREIEDQEIIHIHGNRDEIFSIKYIKNCIIVEQGTHVMILNKAKTISQIIQQNIDNEN